MSKNSWEYGKSLLVACFPLRKVLINEVAVKSPAYTLRVADELSSAKIDGISWDRISVEQARGTWDVLKFISPTSITILLPGYLQWLWNLDEADVLYTALPRLMLELLNNAPRTFNCDQLCGLQEFITSVTELNQSDHSTEEAILYSELIDAIKIAIEKNH